jgi:histidine ammonia-lyase
MSGTITLTPGAATLRQLACVFGGADARLDAACLVRVEAAAAVVARLAAGDAAVYGVNTGFGKLASKRIPVADIAKLQRNLIVSHCCGVGKRAPSELTRLIIALKLISLGRGASGVRPVVIQSLEALLDETVTGAIHIPMQGSVGASGDLAPLAHLTAFMIGAQTSNERLQKLGLTPLVLGPKEGLALINGTQFSTAAALAAVMAARHLACVSLLTGALSVDAAMASTTPFRPEIHALRGHPGQIQAGRTLTALLADSQIRQSHIAGDTRVQDPYCLRCQPQVTGACLDLLDQAAATLVTEANAVTDNPLVLVDTGEIVSGGNFHAEPVAFAADQIALAISEIGAIAERRIATLVDPALNFGLPPFLTPDPGLNSGFMIAEVTAAALMSENKHLANPCSTDSTPTSANQEDHVSMAAHGAVRLQRMVRNLAGILAIELLCAAQGIGMRQPLTTSSPLQRAMARLREDVAPLGEDRVMSGDIANATRLVLARDLIEAAGVEHFPAGWADVAPAMLSLGGTPPSGDPA